MDETNVATAGPRARALLDRLNEWSDRPVVVLCRSIEFGRLQQKGGDNGLHGANTINLDPFPAKKAARHLRNIQKKTGATAPAWGQFIAHLDNEADSPLSGCLQNPWMLGLTLTILRHSPRTATALLDCTSREAVREGLFAAQIPAAIAGSADIKQLRGYTSSQVEKWLRSLSRCLEKRRATPNRDGTAIRLDEIWEVNGNNGIRYAYTGIVGLVYVLTSGYTVALMGYDLVSMPTWVFGVGFIFLIGSTGDLDSPAKRVALTVPRRSRWAQAAVYSFLSLWVCGLYIWVAFGVAVLVAFVLASGLAAGLQVADEDRLSLVADERRTIRHDLLAALVIGLLFGLTIGLAGVLTHGLAAGLALGLTVGLAFGLLTGRATGRFLLAVPAFKVTARFPARPGTFLDWARRSGLLRVDGTAYQFRHATYQQWLLGTDQLHAQRARTRRASSQSTMMRSSFMGSRKAAPPGR